MPSPWLRLEPLSGVHAATLAAMPRESTEPIGRWVEDCLRRAARGLEHRFVAIGPAGELLGLVSLLTLEGEEAHLALWTEPAARGRGVATAAAARLLAFGCRRLALRRVRAEVRVGNAPSRRVLEKLGFELEARGAVLRYRCELH